MICVICLEPLIPETTSPYLAEACRDPVACIARHDARVRLARVAADPKLREPWAQEASSLGEILASLDLVIEVEPKLPVHAATTLPLIREALQTLATNAAERAAGRAP